MAKTKKTEQGALLQITQVRSLSGRPAKHRATMEALGFRKHQQTIVHKDHPAIRGMLFQVRHLVGEQVLGDGPARDRHLGAPFHFGDHFLNDLDQALDFGVAFLAVLPP